MFVNKNIRLKPRQKQKSLPKASSLIIKSIYQTQYAISNSEYIGSYANKLTLATAKRIPMIMLKTTETITLISAPLPADFALSGVVSFQTR